MSLVELLLPPHTHTIANCCGIEGERGYWTGVVEERKQGKNSGGTFVLFNCFVSLTGGVLLEGDWSRWRILGGKSECRRWMDICK